MEKDTHRGSIRLDVEGVWTQAVLIHALSSLDLSRSKYDSAVVSLARLGYGHITIDSGVLVHSAREADWLPAEPFTSVVRLPPPPPGWAAEGELSEHGVEPQDISTGMK